MVALGKPKPYETRLQFLLYSGSKQKKTEGPGGSEPWLCYVKARTTSRRRKACVHATSKSVSSQEVLGLARHCPRSRSPHRAHVTHHLRARRSDPCTRNALKEAHQGLVFLEEMAGSKRGERLSSSPLYATTYKELRNKTGGQDVHLHPGVSGTNVLVLNWSTLRFGDCRTSW